MCLRKKAGFQRNRFRKLSITIKKVTIESIKTGINAFL